MYETNEARRALRGACWGLIGALVVGAFMLVAAAASSAVALRPLPWLVARRMLGPGHGAATVFLAIVGQLLVGAGAGLVFAYLSRPMTLLKGIGYGLFLGFCVGITFVAWLGWGDFGLLHGPGMAAYTLVLHLIYGAVLGSLGDRDEQRHHATFDVLGRLEPWVRSERWTT